MEPPSPVLDLRNIEFEAFVDLLFDHPVRGKEPEPESPITQWYHGVGCRVWYDPGQIAQHYIQLFSHPQFLLKRYTDPQLGSGFQTIPFHWGFEGNVSEILWTRDLGLDRRQALIQSMYHLYNQLFVLKPLWAAPFMWWDTLAFCFHPDLLCDDLYPDSAFIREVMFSVLKEILNIPSEDCRQAALHGMNHLRHPGTAAFIEAFLCSRQDLSSRLVRYAMRCMVFEVE